MSESIVIVGAGHAAAQLCASLVEGGRGAHVQLVGAEPSLPYLRPPLSKAFLKNPEETLQLHRSEAWFADAGVTLHRADPAVSIDRGAQRVRLRSGTELGYRWLVLATGAQPRRLPGLPDSLVNAATLRSAEDALRLRALLAAAQRVTVLGGGFIGLEIAATARALGKAVSVLESAPRLLMRSVSPEIGEHVLRTHRSAGIELLLNVKVDAFEIAGGRLAALQVDGVPRAVELLVLGIGAAPDHALASAAGLACDNGITVDACMRTSDPAILAVGDCVSYPEIRSGRRLRLESVQNANDQARCAAATILGRDQPYAALPWFWSEQGAMRLQMAGLMPADGQRHRRAGANAASFSILHYVGDELVCVESVNAPLDHIASRKLLETRKSPPPVAACDPALPLKSFA